MSTHEHNDGDEWATLLRHSRIHGDPFINLHDAAKSLGLKPSVLSDYEHGRVRPSKTELERICAHYARLKGVNKNRAMMGGRLPHCGVCELEIPSGNPVYCAECLTALETERRTLLGNVAELGAVITEQKHVNDDLAFRLGGLKWEVGHTREMLRHIVAVAYKSRLSNELELALSSVNNYLAGVPKLENES